MKRMGALHRVGTAVFVAAGFLAPARAAEGKGVAPSAELAVRLEPGDVLTYAYRRWTRERAGSGATRVHRERLTEGTVTVLVLETLAAGGLRVAVVGDLEDEARQVSPEGRKPAKHRWRNAVVLRLSARLGPAGEGEALAAPGVGDAHLAEVPEGAPEIPPVVPAPFPPVSLGRLAKEGEWVEEMTPLASFGGPPPGRARHRVERPEARPELALFTREMPGDEVNYTEHFLMDPAGRRLTACEFTYHACGGAGNTRQVTSFEETARRRLDAEALASSVEAAREIEKVSPLLVKNPAGARRRLAALRKKAPGSPFAPAIDAALAGLSGKE